MAKEVVSGFDKSEGDWESIEVRHKNGYILVEVRPGALTSSQKEKLDKAMTSEGFDLTDAYLYDSVLYIFERTKK